MISTKIAVAAFVTFVFIIFVFSTCKRDILVEACFPTLSPPHKSSTTPSSSPSSSSMSDPSDPSDPDPSDPPSSPSSSLISSHKNSFTSPLNFSKSSNSSTLPAFSNSSFSTLSASSSSSNSSSSALAIVIEARRSEQLQKHKQPSEGLQRVIKNLQSGVTNDPTINNNKTMISNNATNVDIRTINGTLGPSRPSATDIIPQRNTFLKMKEHKQLRKRIILSSKNSSSSSSSSSSTSTTSESSSSSSESVSRSVASSGSSSSSSSSISTESEDSELSSSEEALSPPAFSSLSNAFIKSSSVPQIVSQTTPPIAISSLASKPPLPERKTKSPSEASKINSSEVINIIFATPLVNDSSSSVSEEVESIEEGSDEESPSLLSAFSSTSVKPTLLQQRQTIVGEKEEIKRKQQQQQSMMKQTLSLSSSMLFNSSLPAIREVDGEQSKSGEKAGNETLNALVATDSSSEKEGEKQKSEKGSSEATQTISSPESNSCEINSKNNKSEIRNIKSDNKCESSDKSQKGRARNNLNIANASNSHSSESFSIENPNLSSSSREDKHSIAVDDCKLDEKQLENGIEKRQRLRLVPKDIEEQRRQQRITFPVKFRGKEVELSIPKPLFGQCPKGTQLLVLVTSRVTAEAIRDSFRETVKADAPCSVAVFFVVGKPNAGNSQEDKQIWSRVERENAEHGDLIVTNILELYSNQPMKTFVMLKFKVEFCQTAPFLMKIDDDNVVDIPRCLFWIRHKFAKIAAKTNGGVVAFGSPGPAWIKPNRDPNHKLFLTKDDYDGDNFPPYLSGGCYMIAHNAAQRMVEEVQLLPRGLTNTIEDVFFTGVIGNRIGLHRVHVPTHLRVDDPIQVKERCEHALDGSDQWEPQLTTYNALWTEVRAGLTGSTNEVITPKRIRGTYARLHSLRCDPNHPEQVIVQQEQQQQPEQGKQRPIEGMPQPQPLSQPLNLVKNDDMKKGQGKNQQLIKIRRPEDDPENLLNWLRQPQDSALRHKLLHEEAPVRVHQNHHGHRQMIFPCVFQNYAREVIVDLPSSAKLCPPNTKVLFFVLCKVEEFKKRALNRKIWNADLPDTAHLTFVIGNPPLILYKNGHAQKRHQVLLELLKRRLNKEVRRDRDLMHVQIPDQYQNVHFKNQAILIAVKYFCPHVEVIVKLDDDQVFDPQRFFHWLPLTLKPMIDSAPGRKAAIGYLQQDAVVVRNPVNHWYVPKWLFPAPFYPYKYLYGGCIVMSREAVAALCDRRYTAQTILVPIDDTMLGAIAAVSGVRLMNAAEHIRSVERFEREEQCKLSGEKPEPTLFNLGFHGATPGRIIAGHRQLKALHCEMLKDEGGEGKRWVALPEHVYTA